MEKDIEKENVDPCEGATVSLECMINKVDNMPPLKTVYKGIIQPSFGVIFGPAKSGKTIFTENLLFTIAAGQDNFLGDKIHSSTPRVLLISLEEFYRNRTNRNSRQIAALAKRFGIKEEDLIKNIVVANDTFPRYLQKDADWKLLESEIVRHKPSVVMIDSMTRLTTQPIEDSFAATCLMKKLRDLTHKHGISLIVIHHTPKIDNRPLTIASLAGSRVIGQECDFMIGINKTTNGIRYVKDVAYRYAPDDAEQVLKFVINDELIIQETGKVTEAEILSAEERCPENASDRMIKDYFIEHCKDKEDIVKTAELYKAFVDTDKMSRPTLHQALARLQREEFLKKVGKGEYKMVS